MTSMALVSLIEDVSARNEWQDADLVRRAQSRGHRLTKSDVSDYRHRGMRTLVPAKVKALAAALGVAPYLVALAVLADMGIDVPMEARRPEEAIEHDHTLSVKAREHLLAILELDRVA